MTSRAKTTKYASEDDACDLLAEILDDTEVDAAAETKGARGPAAERPRETEAAQRAAANKERLAERQARLARELERQDGLERKRAARREALTAAADLPVEDAEAVEEVPVPVATIDEDAIRRQIAEEVREELRAIGMTPMPEPMAVPVQSTRGGAGLIVGALGIGLAAAAALTFFATSAYEPDQNFYAKAVFAPADPSVAALEVSFVPIPQAAPEVEVELPVKARRVRPAAATPTPKENGSSVFGKAKKTSEERDAYNRLRDALDNAPDPFSSDADNK